MKPHFQTTTNIIKHHQPIFTETIFECVLKFDKKGINDCIKTNDFQTKQKRKKLKKKGKRESL